jgi:CRP-like cAMP-binding protein
MIGSETTIYPGFTKLFTESFAFTNDEYNDLLSCFHIKQIRKKEFYFRAGETCRVRAYLNRGCMRNFVVDVQGHERILFFSFEDWWVGDFESFYTGNPGTNYVQALEDCELLIISKEDFLKIESRNTKLKQWYTFKMARSASASLKRIEELRTLSAEERYLQLLKKQPDIFQRIPLQYIAAYLNIEPQSLSRMRKRLATKT